MIYSYLIRTPKNLTPYARYQKPTRSQGPRQWQFYIRERRGDPVLEESLPPILTQICSESHTYLLEVGSFIFTKSKTDGGLWWNPREDLLRFDLNFNAKFEHYVFKGLGGLEHVRHLHLNGFEVIYQLVCKIQYKSSSGMNTPSHERRVNAAKLSFIKRPDDEGHEDHTDAYDDNKHWLIRYFPRVESCHCIHLFGDGFQVAFEESNEKTVARGYLKQHGGTYSSEPLSLSEEPGNRFPIRA